MRCIQREQRLKMTDPKITIVDKLIRHHEQKLQLAFQILMESEVEFGVQEIQQLLAQTHKELLELLHDATIKSLQKLD